MNIWMKAFQLNIARRQFFAVHKHWTKGKKFTATTIQAKTHRKIRDAKKYKYSSISTSMWALQMPFAVFTIVQCNRFSCFGPADWKVTSSYIIFHSLEAFTLSPIRIRNGICALNVKLHVGIVILKNSWVTWEHIADTKNVHDQLFFIFSFATSSHSIR